MNEEQADKIIALLESIDNHTKYTHDVLQYHYGNSQQIGTIANTLDSIKRDSAYLRSRS